ncbi:MULTISPECIES: glycosyltransferase family 2 protein [Parabacteroides]|uniref:glycosyltransferase family 2 protein n=1 Tax=Parabacteroides TaxID=375288 RepID=UPI000EFF8460|nr:MULTISPECIES: glycosyltransferase family 2 protein [Parabacteroides]MDB9028309.1 glycosyltransferase family 2 protein [Parabacteroides distasonis]MDB9073820.1 glycosyltransferase family 2 protein [Parabacteroides distasonis]RKU61629.1 glycosyltransferase family 2 protein [Parabacteroides sp. AF19-14]
MFVFAIIVTYNPDCSLLRRQYESIWGQVSGIVYVDNHSTCLALPEEDGVYHILNNRNEGLGKAQNQGITFALQKGATHVLLLDQDSVASPHMVDTLLAVEKENRERGKRVGLVGPNVYDLLANPPQYEYANIIEGLRIKRVKLGSETLSVSYCIASGSLISMESINAVGMMKDDLFIDGLDVEWCLRAKALGFEILITPQTSLTHRLGNGEKGKILSHSPQREYFICRNNLRISSYSYIPLRFRLRKKILVPMRIVSSLLHGHWAHFKAGMQGALDCNKSISLNKRIQMKRFKRLIKDWIKSRRLKKYYNLAGNKAGNTSQWIIYMADGKILHGGLSDRLCGLVSTYCYCKGHNISFKAFFHSPYDLEIFLQPNTYDWRIGEEDLSYHSEDALPIYISYDENHLDSRRKANGKLCKKNKQLHVYTNIRYFANEDFKVLFDELFKPSAQLLALVRFNLERIGGVFISVTFRFQQLLGDFTEGNFPILPESERNGLLDKCLSKIEDLHSLHLGKRILVTSDSKTFLSKAATLGYTYIIPGDVIHLEYTPAENLDIHMKSFVDLLMVSKASKVYLVFSDLLYHSTFAKTASLISGTQYEEILLP